MVPVIFLIEQKLQEIKGKENKSRGKEKKKSHLHESSVVPLVQMLLLITTDHCPKSYEGLHL